MIEPDVDMRLLLVEKNRGLRADLTRALERAGFGVEAHAEATAADRLTQGRGISLRVLDQSTPGVSAWLEHGSFEGPTLLLVGDSAAVIPRPCSAAGPMELLYKPFSLPVLEARIAQRLGLAASENGSRVDPILETRDPDFARVLGRARRLARRPVSISFVGELGTSDRDEENSCTVERFIGGAEGDRSLDVHSPKGIELPVFAEP